MGHLVLFKVKSIDIGHIQYQSNFTMDMKFE